MKNISTQLALICSTCLIAGFVYSFTQAEEKPSKKMKKIEVLRSVDGNIKSYDTLVSIDSPYTVQDYLSELGFDKDKHIEIIDLLTPTAFKIDQLKGSDGQEVEAIFITSDEDIEEFETENGGKKIIIHKEVRHDLGEDADDIEEILKEINVDSIIQEVAGDGKVIEINKMMVTSEEYTGDGDEKLFHELDTNGATFTRKYEGDNQQTQIAYWGDGDYTIALIYASEDENKRDIKPMRSEKAAPSYISPNPSTGNSTLHLNFEESAPLTISILDMRGQLVHELDLGQVVGKYEHELQTDTWAKGMYIVQVRHGQDKEVKKLLIK